MHSFSKLITFAALVFTTFAAKEDCFYDVWGSESDSQTDGYQFCTQSPLERLTKDYAKITANLAGKAYICNPLEPDKTEEELKANLGIDIRPYFKATLAQNPDTEAWEMTVGQYGDPYCMYAQRKTVINWGVGQCKQGIKSEGAVTEMYFVNDDCAGLGDATQEELDNVAKQSFRIVPATDSETLQDLLIDPYPVLAGATKNNLYFVNNKVLSKSYTAPAGRHTGYCYGIGQKFQAPYHLATMYNNSGVMTYYNEIFLPASGSLCGYSCTADITEAVTNATKDGVVAKAPAYFALTLCGMGYKLNTTYNETNKDTAPFYGLDQGHYFFASLILHYSNPKVCNKCVNDATSLARDPLVGLLSMTPGVTDVPKSRFVLCQPDVNSVSYVFQEKASGPADPNNCSPVPTASQMSSGTVASSDVTSNANAFSVFSVIFAVLASFLAF